MAASAENFIRASDVIVFALHAMDAAIAAYRAWRRRGSLNASSWQRAWRQPALALAQHMEMEGEDSAVFGVADASVSIWDCGTNEQRRFSISRTDRPWFGGTISRRYGITLSSLPVLHCLICTPRGLAHMLRAYPLRIAPIAPAYHSRLISACENEKQRGAAWWRGGHHRWRHHQYGGAYQQKASRRHGALTQRWRQRGSA